MDSRVSGYSENHWQQLKKKEGTSKQTNKQTKNQGEKLCAKDCMLRPRDQHGFAITPPCPSCREVLAGPLVLLYLLLFEDKSPEFVLFGFQSVACLFFGFRFPNTMNFIDSLTLLFLTLSAVKVSCRERAGGEKIVTERRTKNI